jgi:hypothetical protein
MGVLAAAIAAALGLGAAWAFRLRPRARGAVRGIARWVAALAATVYAAAFAAGVIGAVASGDISPVLITLAVGLIVAAALLWRGRRRPGAVGGHAVAALWLLYSAFAARRSAGASLLFVAVSLPALFTAAAGVDLGLPPRGPRDGPGAPGRGEGGRPWRESQ